MQWEPVAMHHQLSSFQKSCSPEGQHTACPSPSLPDTPHPLPTLPCHLPFPCSHGWIMLWSIQARALPNSAPLFLTASLALGDYFNSSLYPPLFSCVVRSQVCHAHCSAWEALHPFLNDTRWPGIFLPSLPSSTQPFSPTATSSAGERGMQPFPLTSLRRPALFPSPCHLLTCKRAGRSGSPPP